MHVGSNPLSHTRGVKEVGTLCFQAQQPQPTALGVCVSVKLPCTPAELLSQCDVKVNKVPKYPFSGWLLCLKLHHENH